MNNTIKPLPNGDFEVLTLSAAERGEKPKRYSTTLCERCCPQWREHEILTIPAMMPCDGCGSYEDGRHVFRRDPRA